MTDYGQPILVTHNGELRIEYENGRLIVNKAGTDIMLAGNDLEGDVVIKIAKPGIDVKTATDDQLIFNSSQNVFKIVKTVSGTFPPVSVSTTTGFSYNQSGPVTIPHDMGYIPVYTAYSETLGTTVNTTQLFGGSDYIGAANFTIAADDTNFYLYTNANVHANAGASRAVNAGPADVNIYILQESAA